MAKNTKLNQATTNFDLTDEDLIGSFTRRPANLEASKPTVEPAVQPVLSEPITPLEARREESRAPTSNPSEASTSEAVEVHPDQERIQLENERLSTQNQELHKRIAQLEQEVTLAKGSKKDRQKTYTEQFLNKNSNLIESGRYQIYISKDTNDALTMAHGALTKIPYSHFVDNILQNHMQVFSDIIQEAIKEQSAKSLKRFKT